MVKYRFEQIAINSTEKKKPVEEDRFTYLGLEHLDSGSLKVTRFGSEVAPIGEKLVMHKGDVLFGKRRAYQKKVAIAPFDGIFSAHGMVLRPREDVIDKSFFPLFISSDYFLDAAIKISVGSLSPTINWRDLKTLEFELPDLATQRKLAETLWSINDTMETYKKLIAATDELVKSQFMELFGDPKTNQKGLPILKIGEFGKVKGGKRLPKGESYADHTTNHPYVRVIDMVKHSVTIPALVYLTQATHEKISRYTISSKDVYISIAGTIGQVGAIPDSIDGANLTENAAKIVLNEGAPVDRDYLIWYLSLPAGAEQIEEKTMHTTQPKLALYRIEEIEVLVPPIAEQRSFAAFVQQSDKSQFIEHFGKPGTDPFGWGLTTLGECCELNPRKPKDMNTNIDYSFVAMPSVSEDGRIDSSIERPYSEVCKGFTYFGENDVLFAKITPCMENGKGGVAKKLKNGAGFGSTEFHVLRPIKGISDPYWIYILTIFPKFRSDAEKVMTGTGGQRRVPITYLNEYPIALPPIDLQEQFAAFVRQSDKSKFAALSCSNLNLWSCSGIP